MTTDTITEAGTEPPKRSAAWGYWKGRAEQIATYGHAPRLPVLRGRDCVDCGRRVVSDGPFGLRHVTE